jgi:hypothetical protein
MSMGRDAGGKLRDLSASESLDVIADLKSGLRFRRDERLWTDTRQSGPPFGFPFPYIVNTSPGKEIGFRILEQRGYQWWRQRK